MTDAADVVERIVREGYGRLLAYLAGGTNDPASAQDALGEAVARALVRWPLDGVPAHPEAWLLRTARNWAIDGARRNRRLVPLDAVAERGIEMMGSEGFPDERLKLLFACAHPAILPADRTPLMLQLVLGLSAAAIASAFATSPVAMAARLGRAKEKIRIAGIPFRVPEEPLRAERLSDVLLAIYVAYERGRDEPTREVEPGEGLVEEALWLAGLLAGLMPDEPEALGLLALLLFVESRRRAARADGYVPLSRQETGLWDGTLRREADDLLWRALAHRAPGRFQLEAAIQSAHMAARLEGVDVRRAVVQLYRTLLGLAPTLGAAVGHAVAVAELEGPAAGLVLLDAIALASDRFQPFWAARAHLLASSGEPADEAYRRAIDLADDPLVREYLESRRGA